MAEDARPRAISRDVLYMRVKYMIYACIYHIQAGSGMAEGARPRAISRDVCPEFY